MASDETYLRNGNSKEPSVEDDWERKIDNGTLDKEIEKLTLKNGSKNPSLDGDDKTNLNDPPKVQVRLEDPPMRTPFAPGVRILRREPLPQPNNQNSSSTKSSVAPTQTRSPATTKSFDERVHDYNKARERIMGTQTAPSPPNGNLRPTLLETPNNRYQLQQQQPQQIQPRHLQPQARYQQFNREKRPNNR